MEPRHQEQRIRAALEALPRVITTITMPLGLIKEGVKQGTLRRIMPGRYTLVTQLPQATLPRYQRIEMIAKLKLAAGVTKIVHNEVLSHSSAGELWGFPRFGTDLRVHTIRAGQNPRARQGFARHMARLEPGDIVTVDGTAVTSLERTALDLAASLSPEQCLAILDHALGMGVNKQVLEEKALLRRGKGSAQVRRLLRLAVAGSESVQESICRYWLHQAGVGEVETQVWIDTNRGRFRVDMLIRGVRLVIEYDGEVKYQDDAGALVREKVREDAIRAQGWDFLRVTKKDLVSPEKFVALVRRRVARLKERNRT